MTLSDINLALANASHLERKAKAQEKRIKDLQAAVVYLLRQVEEINPGLHPGEFQEVLKSVEDA